MGVLGLWNILLTTAKPIRLEELSGRVLAVDVSIWLVKASSIFEQRAQQWKCMLEKIVMLKRHNILPLFVFDGVAPALKKNTLLSRRACRRSEESHIAKLTEIEVVKRLEGRGGSGGQCEKTLRYQAQMSEINSIIADLQKIADGDSHQDAEYLEKTELQSRILTSKYELLLSDKLLEMRRCLSVEEFDCLDLEGKVQYLSEVEEFRWRHTKQLRDSQQHSSDLTPEQQVRRQLKVIEKRGKVRQMQDALYRKMFRNNLKIENGFQVVESIYNGKKVIQKRKVRNGPCVPVKKMKNNYNFEKGEMKQMDSPDQFLSQFCTNQPPRITVPRCEPSNILNELVADGGDEKELEGNDAVLQQALLINKESQQLVESISNRDNLPARQNYEPNPLLPSNDDYLELQSILTLCGLPFIIAPSEAEAQCSDLQIRGIVDGVITQDSDAFLFGARNVFRGVFQNSVRHYNAERINLRLGLNRQKMIILALLLGSDYTGGVKGVGIVNSMEIVKVFDTVGKLEKFKNWSRHADVILDEQHQTATLLESCTALEKQFFLLHRRYKNYWFVDHDFPKQSVIDAYLHPEVIDAQRLLSLQSQRKLLSHPPNFAPLKLILSDQLQMHQKQLEHYSRCLGLQFTPNKQTNITDYFERKVVSRPDLGEIRSRRLKRAVERKQ